MSARYIVQEDEPAVVTTLGHAIAQAAGDKVEYVAIDPPEKGLEWWRVWARRGPAIGQYYPDLAQIERMVASELDLMAPFIARNLIAGIDYEYEKRGLLPAREDQ